MMSIRPTTLFSLSSSAIFDVAADELSAWPVNNEGAGRLSTMVQVPHTAG